MNTRWTTWLAIALWTALLLSTCVMFILLKANGDLKAVLFADGYVMFFPMVGSLGTVGTLLAVHRPRNAIGWIFLLAGLGGSIFGIADRYAFYIVDQAPNALPDVPLLFWLGTWTWVIAFLLPPTFGILLFPTGRLPSRRWRPFAWAIAALLILGVIAAILSPDLFVGPEAGRTPLKNPTGIASTGYTIDLIYTYGTLVFVAGFGGALASIFARLRAASTVERQQIKWFAVAATIPVAGIVVMFITGSEDRAQTGLGEYLALSGLVILPVAIGIAIMRHNLYDIDRLINRTLVYGLLTALLLISFAGGVLLFQFLFRQFTGGNDMAVAGSTLLTLALFRPVRSRLQSFVDQRFYRKKYDAQRTLGAFAIAARDAVDLDQLTEELTTVVSKSIQPRHVSVWLRAETAERDRR